VRIDVVDLADALGVEAVHRHPHAAHGAFAGGCHHVKAVRGCTVPDHLAIDFSAAVFGVLQLFHHDDAGASGNDKPVTVLVIGATRLGRGLVVPGGHGAHGVE